jgi:hypothetical protein
VGHLVGWAHGDRGLRPANLGCSPPIKWQKEVCGGRGGLEGARNWRREMGPGPGIWGMTTGQIANRVKGDGEKWVQRACFSARVGSGILDKRVRS